MRSDICLLGLREGDSYREETSSEFSKHISVLNYRCSSSEENPGIDKKLPNRRHGSRHQNRLLVPPEGFSALLDVTTAKGQELHPSVLDDPSNTRHAKSPRSD